nr:unnamed protein product [Spirometra erinaceieuropaei]
MVYIVYDAGVWDTKTNGTVQIINATFNSFDKHLLTVPYLHRLFKGKDAVMLTGHIRNAALYYKIKVKNGMEILSVIPNAAFVSPRVIHVSFNNTEDSAWLTQALRIPGC